MVWRLDLLEYAMNQEKLKDRYQVLQEYSMVIMTKMMSRVLTSHC